MPKPGEPKQHVPIFVGSTYEDLKPYRDATMDALVRMEHIVRGMEYFGSKPGSPKKECLKAVQSCRVYIGVFAMRYGSVDPETGKSMTHLEYDEAQRLRLPTLIYLVDEDKQPVLPKHVDTGENAEKLRDLKRELRRIFTVSFFTTPEDLARRVSQDLPGILADAGFEVAKEEGSGDALQAVGDPEGGGSGLVSRMLGPNVPELVEEWQAKILSKVEQLEVGAMGLEDARSMLRSYLHRLTQERTRYVEEMAQQIDEMPGQLQRQMPEGGVHVAVAIAATVSKAAGYLKASEVLLEVLPDILTICNDTSLTLGDIRRCTTSRFERVLFEIQ